MQSMFCHKLHICHIEYALFFKLRELRFARWFERQVLHDWS
jgi:hypothetical protein